MYVHIMQESEKRLFQDPKIISVITYALYNITQNMLHIYIYT
jgi:hypothetical protein